MNQSTIAEVNSEVNRALLVLSCVHDETTTLILTVALYIEHAVEIFYL